MKKFFEKIFILIVIMAILISQCTVVKAGTGDSNVLEPVYDTGNHGSLQWTVQGVSSTSATQAFVVGWNLTFRAGSMATNVYVPRKMDNWSSNPVTYVFPLTDQWTGDAMYGMGLTDEGKQGTCIEDFSHYQYTYEQIIGYETGFTVEANAVIQKYSYNSSKPSGQQYSPIGTPYSPTAYPSTSTSSNIADDYTELQSDFSEFSADYLTNSKVYFNIDFLMVREAPYEHNIKPIFWDSATNQQVNVGQADITHEGYKSEINSTTENYPNPTIPVGYEITGYTLKYTSEMPTFFGDYNAWDKVLYFPLKQSSDTSVQKTKTAYLHIKLTQNKPYNHKLHIQYWDKATGQKLSISHPDINVSDTKSTTKTFVPSSSIPSKYDVEGYNLKYSSSAPSSWANYSSWDKKVYFPLAEPNTEGWLNILLNDPNAASSGGYIHVKYIDSATNTEIRAEEKLTILTLNEPVKVDQPTDIFSDFEGSYQSFTATVDKTKVTSGVTSQTVTLTSTKKEAYVYFWYKGNSTPPPPVSQPPHAILNNTAMAYVGDDVSFNGSHSYDTDGVITDYAWSLSGAYENTVGNIASGTTSYPNDGTYGIGLTVTDDSGLTDDANGSVMILPPNPQIQFTVSGTKMKENRKITLDVSSSTSPSKFPIDWSLTAWTIDPVNGSGATGDYGVRFTDGRVYKNVGGIAHKYNAGTWTNTGIPFNSVLTGQRTLYFQARDSGQYTATVIMTNTATFDSTKHYVNYDTKTINVSVDLAPLADFSCPSFNIREKESPNGSAAQNYGIIPITCTTTSPDLDPIGVRKWTMRYDSNNDGVISNEISINKYAPNLINDENFLDIPNNWGVWTESGVPAPYSIVTSDCGVGTKAFNGIADPYGIIGIYCAGITNEVIAGKKYTNSAYIKTQNLTGSINVQTYWMNAQGSWVWENVVSSKSLTGSNGWTRLDVTQTAPATAKYAYIMISVSACSGVYWIGAPQIEQGSVPTAFNTSYNTPFTSGYRLIVNDDKSNLAEIWTYDVGKYPTSLLAYEDILDSETVTELLITSDYKSNYVSPW